MRLAHTECSAVIAVPRQNCQVAADGSADNARYVTLIEKSVRRADTEMYSYVIPPLLIQCFCFFKYLVDGSCKQEAALRKIIALAVKDHAESAQSFF